MPKQDQPEYDDVMNNFAQPFDMVDNVMYFGTNNAAMKKYFEERKHQKFQYPGQTVHGNDFLWRFIQQMKKTMAWTMAWIVITSVLLRCGRWFFRRR